MFLSTKCYILPSKLDQSLGFSGICQVKRASAQAGGAIFTKQANHKGIIQRIETGKVRPSAKVCVWLVCNFPCLYFLENSLRKIQNKLLVCILCRQHLACFLLTNWIGTGWLDYSEPAVDPRASIELMMHQVFPEFIAHTFFRANKWVKTKTNLNFSSLHWLTDNRPTISLVIPTFILVPAGRFWNLTQNYFFYYILIFFIGQR